MHCYHVKDWLKNDPEYTSHSNSEIEKFVNDTKPLAIAADLCNSSKHLILDTRPRSGETPTLAGRVFNLHVGSGTPDSMNVRIAHGQDVFDAFNIATQAMESWDNFVSNGNF